MRKATYILEVYPPGNVLDDAAFSVESETPFPAFSRGDIFAACSIEGFPDSSFTAPIGAVIHWVWSARENSITYKTGLFLGDDCWNNLREVLENKVAAESVLT